MSDKKIVALEQSKIKSRRDEWNEILSRIQEFQRVPLTKAMRELRRLGYTNAAIAKVVDFDPAVITRIFGRENV